MYTDVFRIYAVYRLCIQDIPSVPRRVKGNPRCTSAFHDDLSTWQSVCVIARPREDDGTTIARRREDACEDERTTMLKPRANIGI